MKPHSRQTTILEVPERDAAMSEKSVPRNAPARTARHRLCSQGVVATVRREWLLSFRGL